IRRAGDRSWRRWSVRIGAAAAMAAALAYLPQGMLGGGGDQLDRVRRELGHARRESEELRARNAELRRAIRALPRDPGAIEDLARREPGAVQPGELVLRREAL